ncbi:N-acetylmuramic acid 6-phosphate etherase [Rhizobiales bacterium GAS191]|nr:N-acetylmuramic acid 6-phosphate etherase [Rhizobiales bacterium GAS113]SEC95649.1 N-acetylmuramic acid 6-phosphate etherase [Rhizobiales bacterium GAS191]
MTIETEGLSPRFAELDEWSTPEVLKALYEGQLLAVAAVCAALPALGRAADAAAAILSRGKGRVVYAGAGTSVRIGVQDGAELPPTFDWPEMRLGFVIAGSEQAILTAVEGAEDSQSDAIERVRQLGVGREDVVIGVAASGTTPFTVAAIAESRRLGALTIGVANNPGTPLLGASEHPILIETGEEVVAGSTRMKAGTAQKIVLNLLSTAVMIRLGRVYKGMMVDFRVTNAKLRQRSEAMVAKIAGCEAEPAARALREAHGEVKLASLLALGAKRDEAEAALQRHDGNLRLALRELRRSRAVSDGERHG